MLTACEQDQDRTGTKPVPSWSCSKAVSEPFGSAAEEPKQFCPDPACKLSANRLVLLLKNQTSSILILLASCQQTIWFCCWRTKPVPSWSCSQAVSKPVWHIPLLCVQWKSPDDGRRNCLKHVQFYSKNKFEKLVHLVGFIIWICHDTWSPERQICQQFSSVEQEGLTIMWEYQSNVDHVFVFSCLVTMHYITVILKDQH